MRRIEVKWFFTPRRVKSWKWCAHKVAGCCKKSIVSTLCLRPRSHWSCLAASASEWAAWRGRRPLSGRSAARRSSARAGGGCIARWRPAGRRTCVFFSPSEKGRGGTAAGEGRVRKGIGTFPPSVTLAVGLPEARSRQKPRETPQCSTHRRNHPTRGKKVSSSCFVKMH